MTLLLTSYYRANCYYSGSKQIDSITGYPLSPCALFYSHVLSLCLTEERAGVTGSVPLSSTTSATASFSQREGGDREEEGRRVRRGHVIS